MIIKSPNQTLSSGVLHLKVNSSLNLGRNIRLRKNHLRNFRLGKAKSLISGVNQLCKSLMNRGRSQLANGNGNRIYQKLKSTSTYVKILLCQYSKNSSELFKLKTLVLINRRCRIYTLANHVIIIRSLRLKQSVSIIKTYRKHKKLPSTNLTQIKSQCIKEILRTPI